MNFLTFSMMASILAYHFSHNFQFFLIWGAMIVFYFMSNRSINKKFPSSAHQIWKNISFHDGGQPGIFSREEFDLTDVEIFLDKWNNEHPNEKITLSHLMVKGMASVLSYTKRNCGVITFGHFIPRESVDIGLLVDIDGKNLGNVKIKDANSCSLREISAQLKQTVSKMKKGKDLVRQIITFSLGPDCPNKK